eukprot:TRINITY_DN7944_c0_g1_i2.p2 TRINITY_DN7944_c0_g1~~TRINITY_DN7944_c0_g1_i2.p2  ORF type:complete len:281 (+),score=25.07 TRINITY_DN7944_c0_g1_i2:1133-1975(+)
MRIARRMLTPWKKSQGIWRETQIMTAKAASFLRADDLPSADVFAAAGTTGWSAHPDAKDWLFKDVAKVFYHMPTSSLWRRNGSLNALVRLDDVCGRAALSLASASSPTFSRAVLLAWRSIADVNRKWRLMCTDDFGREACAPRLRTAARGHARRNRHGVSPPPLHKKTWVDIGHGWQWHETAPKWLRKPNNFEGHVYFYLPNESLWRTLPSGLFVCVDTYESALAVLSSSLHHYLLRTCLRGWSCQVSIIKRWRHKISITARSGTEACQEQDRLVPSLMA